MILLIMAILGSFALAFHFHSIWAFVGFGLFLLLCHLMERPDPDEVADELYRRRQLELAEQAHDPWEPLP